MTKKFSASAQGFYDTDVHQPADIPEDAVDISDLDHLALMGDQRSGKKLEFTPEAVTSSSRVIGRRGVSSIIQT